jgi:pyrimidine operon attenuation protein/uracil phosphoribosyltransferase
LERILNALDSEVEFGKLDAAMYRDDYAQRGLKSKSQQSWITFDINNKHIILIDDIFYTGRTTRAAMNELFDFGRPASITLAALINRGGAQLPIQPQIVGANIPLNSNQTFQLSQDTMGKFHLSLEENSDGALSHV